MNRIYSLGCIFLSIIILISLVNAQPSADYQIIGNKVLVELNFDSVQNFKWIIPYYASGFELNTENYVIEDRDYDKLIKISSAENLNIKYISDSYLEQSGNKYFFILKNQFDELSDVVLYLPEGAVLDESISVSPSPDSTTSDGRRIILNWNDFNDEQILVTYEFLDKNTFFYYTIIIILIIIFIAFYITKQRKFKRELRKHKEKVKNKVKGNRKEKKEAELTKNLFEDEKKIVKYLLDKKDNESWTKEILRDLNITKVKLSRKLRSLEQKEIIKRIPYGNENRIRLLK